MEHQYPSHSFLLSYFLLFVIFLNSFTYMFESNAFQGSLPPHSVNSPISNSLPISESGNNSIILLIGDGMGINQINFGNLVENGAEEISPLLSFPFETTISTQNIDHLTTDSAAAATAIATGIKTRNKRIAQNWDGSQNLTTILEFAQSQGYSTGLVAKSHLTHATPASFAAHNTNRNDYTNIAQNFVRTQVDLMLGGGSGDNYLRSTLPDYLALGYQYITQKEPINNLSLPLIGLFASTSLPSAEFYEEDTEIPTLLEMSGLALELLSNVSRPFFLMIEASQIDWAGHDHDSVYLAHEMIEFAETVQFVKSWAQNFTNVQVLVTADHETGGFSYDTPDLQYFSSENEFPIPQDNDTLTERQIKRTTRAEAINVHWNAIGHTQSEVLFAGLGPSTENIQNASHLIDVFGIMRQAIDGIALPISKESNKNYIPLTLWVVFGIIGGVAISILSTIYWRRYHHTNKKEKK